MIKESQVRAEITLIFTIISFVSSIIIGILEQSLWVVSFTILICIVLILLPISELWGKNE